MSGGLNALSRPVRLIKSEQLRERNPFGTWPSLYYNSVRHSDKD